MSFRDDVMFFWRNVMEEDGCCNIDYEWHFKNLDKAISCAEGIVEWMDEHFWSYEYVKSHKRTTVVMVYAKSPIESDWAQVYLTLKVNQFPNDNCSVSVSVLGANDTKIFKRTMKFLADYEVKR